jgi:hypothetical protein
VKIFLDKVVEKAYNYSMKKYLKKPWSDAEKNLLKDYYYTLSKDELFKVLPGRGLNAIVKQVQYLKRRNQRFKS